MISRGMNTELNIFTSILPFQEEPCSSSCRTQCHCGRPKFKPSLKDTKIVFTKLKPWPPAVDVPERRENYDEVGVPFLLLVTVKEIFDNMLPLWMRPAKFSMVAVIVIIIIS